MKIVFAIPRLTYSGAPKMLAWVANQMAKKGHDVKIAAYFSEEQGRELEDSIEFRYLNAVQSKSRLIRNTIGMLKTLTALDKYIKSEKPDVFVSFLDSVGYMYLPLARKRCKVVVSERVDPYTYKGIISKIRFYLMKYADKCVFQTAGAQKFFNGKYDNIFKKSVVIPNPVVLNDSIKDFMEQIPTYEERDNRIVAVGRLSLHQKRQDILIKAFDIVHKTHPELKLVIYGDGADKDRIQGMIDAMNFADCVKLAGRISGVEEEILKARAFVLTSDFEGIPNALIEALSIGVPSVATDCSPGGAAILIKDGENGFLVPKGDVKAVAEGLLKIIENKEISDRFTENGPKICDGFSEEKTAHMWENVFEELCGGKTR